MLQRELASLHSPAYTARLPGNPGATPTQSREKGKL